MSSVKMPSILRLLISTMLLSCVTAVASPYKYFRQGEKSDGQATPVFGIAMMGGGDDLDDAFRWLCQKSGGGDFLILRARGDDEYNPYVKGLCKLNSVATLIIPNRKAAQDPKVAEIIRQAEAVFIAGGDQSRYVNFWKGTPVQDALNANITAGKPIGGTSAGLAVLGQFAYGALGDQPDDPDLSSPQVLRDPFFARVTLVRDFLKISLLQNTLTDTHFAKRDRLGRTLGFLARVMQDGWSTLPREIAVDEKSAVLVEADGKSAVVGSGRGAYFLRPAGPPAVCKEKTPLTFRSISVCRVPTGGHFDLQSWTGEGGASYSLSVDEGVIHSTQAGGDMY
jgi:cyanophycinase